MQDREFIRTDATAEVQARLDNDIRAKYPLINNRASLLAYKRKDTDFASIRLQKGEALSVVLDTALERASDPKDVAFCEHANLHGNFQEVVGILRESIQDRRVSIKTLPNEFAVTIGEKSVIVAAHRLVVEAPRRMRATFRPGPHQFHIELEHVLKKTPQQQREAVTKKVLRKAAEEYGVPFAIIAGIYSGLTASPLVEIFNNQDVRARIKAERAKRGVKDAKIPADNAKDHTALHRMIGRMRPIITVDEGKLRPSYHSKDYFDALQEFDNGYWKDFSPELKEFIQINDLVTPRAVFAGLDEVAQRLAGPNFIDPHRTNYIDRTFWPYTSTQMITAYFESLIEPTSHRFSQTITGRK